MIIFTGKGREEDRSRPQLWSRLLSPEKGILASPLLELLYMILGGGAQAPDPPRTPLRVYAASWESLESSYRVPLRQIPDHHVLQFLPPGFLQV